MAGVRGAIVVFLVLACIAAEPALGQSDHAGRPRPTGYVDTPSKEYGATPPCLLNGAAVKCEWYGFAHTLYPVQGENCMVLMRRAFSNTTLVPVGDLEPYVYYFHPQFVFDKTTNDSYCLYGCFDMSADSPVSSPAPGSAPPPVTSPPPASLYPPPPVADMAPPPDLADAPPPDLADAPSPDLADASPPSALSAPPPPPGNTRVINLNGAAFLQPTGLLSLIISGALLILHGLLAR